MDWKEARTNISILLNVIGVILVIALLVMVYTFPQGKEFLSYQQHKLIIETYDACNATGYAPVFKCTDLRPTPNYNFTNWSVKQ